MAHVLVVDDRQANREFFSYVVGYFGHRVTQADSGQRAVELANLDHPDLIVMDLLMPGVDGYEAVRLMRADPALDGVPIIAVSAAGSSSEAAAREAGFDAFFRIPIEPEAFLAALSPFFDTAGKT